MEPFSWDWKKIGTVALIVVATVAVAALTVVTFGTGTLALVAVAGIVATGGFLAYAAATDSVAVIDLSYTTPTNQKFGISFVADFKGKNFEVYGHVGQTVGASGGFSYSVGLVRNYGGPGSYAGPFVYGGGGYFVGVDHCFDPRNPWNKSIQATTLTFGNGPSAYYGIDYYFKLF